MWNRLRECGWICEWDGKSQLGGKLFVNNYKRPRVYFSFFFNQIVTFRNKLTSLDEHSILKSSLFTRRGRNRKGGVEN